MEYPLYMTNNFLFCFQDSLFVFNFRQFEYNMSQYDSGFFQLEIFQFLVSMLFSQIWVFFFFFNCYFFKVLFHFLSSSLEIVIMCVFIPVTSFCKVLSHSVLSFILFCFHSSLSMISNALPSSLLILSSTYSFFLLLSVLVLNTYN